MSLPFLSRRNKRPDDTFMTIRFTRKTGRIVIYFSDVAVLGETGKEEKIFMYDEAGDDPGEEEVNGKVWN